MKRGDVTGSEPGSSAIGSGTDTQRHGEVGWGLGEIGCEAGAAASILRPVVGMKPMRPIAEQRDCEMPGPDDIS